MKNLSRILSVVAWTTAIVIAWTERRSAQAQASRLRPSAGPAPSQTVATDRGDGEISASAESPASGTPPGAAPESGAAPALTDQPSAATPTHTPAADVDTVTAGIGIPAVSDPAGDPQVEGILGTSSIQGDETSGLPTGPDSAASDTTSAAADDACAAAPSDAAVAPRGDREGSGGRSTASTDGEAGGPVNSVPGTGTDACPDGYPVKGNASSRIYHLPGESSYDRTVPEICFATAEDAAAAGFRPRKH